MSLQSCHALAIKMCVIHHKCDINSVEVYTVKAFILASLKFGGFEI